MTYRPVTHVIFDLDGTILDAEPLYDAMYTKVLAKYGVNFQEVRSLITGASEIDGLKVLVDVLKLSVTPEQLLSEITADYATGLRGAPLMPGAEKLIKHLHKHKIPIAIATSTREEDFDLKTEHFKELFSLFYHVTMPTHPGVEHGKPHPDIFLVCASRFSPAPKPENCLVFEDSVNGMRGARAAGMQIVLVPDPDADKTAFHEATLVLSSLKEFQPELFSLPPFCKCSMNKR